MKPVWGNIRRFFTSQYFIFSLLLTLKAIFIHIFLLHDFDFIKAFILEGCYIFLLLGLMEFLPARFKSLGYFIADGILTTLFAAIIVYTAYFNTVPTYFVLFQLGQVSAISDSILSLLNPFYLLLYLDIIILIVFRYSKKLPFPTAKLNKKWMKASITIAVILTLGGFIYYQGVDIANPVLAAGNKGIFNYELLNIYKDPRAKVKPLDSNLTPADINDKVQRIKGIVTKKPDERKMYGVAKGRNVIVVQMESFQDFLIGLKVNGQEVTPNLNKLIKHSLYFPNVFQQVGPGNTSDAEFIMNTSLFPQSYSATSISEGNRKYPSLPRLLHEKGYNTMTFHADELKFWNRDELYPALGFDHFYEQPLYGNKDIVGLGPSDDVLYAKAIEKLKASPEPFYAHVISMSSHHPYKIPDDKKGLDLPDSYDGSIVGDYLQAQHYTDASLGRFMDKLKKNGLWKNSVLLFYGDHFGLDNKMLGSNDQALLQSLLGHPYSSADRYNIPFIATIPGVTHGEIDGAIGGQLDFLPTLTNLLGLPIDNKIVHFGQDLLNTDHNLIGMRYYMPEGSFINQSIIFEPNTNFDDGTATNLWTREPVNDFKKYKEDYDRVNELENLSDAYVLSLPEQITANKRQ
ncbi:LTA synthase family protein [Camelliibacillus cellulosilyticus]|uniref:LTA synthase family protein n=1 Tax=Camelliibacillus cellulosilyticus TaxID=2174486 RepID=A0ABV9GMN1_9BACL